MASRLRVAVAALFLMGASVPAFAQGPGLQVGVSGDPSQFYFGGQYELSTGIDRLWFRPNVEVGFGNHLTLVGFNFEFAYRMPLPRTDWRLYFGGGPALNVTRVHDVSNSGGGLNFLIGISHRKGLFTELKVGLVDSPSVRFGVGYTF